MSRIKEVVSQTTVREKVAPLTEIFWNPEDNTGEVKFWMKDLVKLKGASEFIGIEDPYDGRSLLRADFAELVDQTFSTPLGAVTGAQIMLAFKVMFDQLYRERFPE